MGFGGKGRQKGSTLPPVRVNRLGLPVWRRICLRCDKPFEAPSSVNRICNRCQRV